MIQNKTNHKYWEVALFALSHLCSMLWQPTLYYIVQWPQIHGVSAWALKARVHGLAKVVGAEGGT